MRPIPATGHTLGESHRENEVEADCEHGGEYDEVVRCTVCDDILSTEHKTAEPFGHKCTDADYTWADGNSSVTTQHHCSVCGKEETETVATSSEVTKESTETQPGEMTITARFETPSFETQVKTEDIPLHGETFCGG